MVELKGYEEQRLAARPKGVEHGAVKGRQSWLERKQAAESSLGYDDQPYCVIVGGGQGGIALGARLRQLDVPTIILEKNSRPGDSWRRRYKSLCLHDPVWYDHLPYVKFPENWPVFSPKDKIADWLEAYTKVMELNYWGSSEAIHAQYDEDAGEWTVDVVRHHDDGTEEQVVLKPKQLVMATGMSGVPNVPEIPGAETFHGRDPPLQRAQGQRGLRRSQVHRARVEQLGPRHLRRAVGERRRRDDDPALVDAHRPLRHPDGARPR